MHRPLLCVANRWHAAFCGKLNIYSQHCLRPFEGFVDPPTTAAHMTLIAETGSSLVHRQMSELLWQNCKLRSQMMRWLHTKAPEHVRHSLIDTCTQVAWSAVPHTDMPFSAMQCTRFHPMILGMGASDVGFKPKATAENKLYMDVHTQTHTVQSQQTDRASLPQSETPVSCCTVLLTDTVQQHCWSFTLSLLHEKPELFPFVLALCWVGPVWVKHVIICVRAWKYLYYLLFLRFLLSFILRVGSEAKHEGGCLHWATMILHRNPQHNLLHKRKVKPKESCCVHYRALVMCRHVSWCRLPANSFINDLRVWYSPRKKKLKNV